MTLRSALRQSPWLAFVMLLAFLWLLVNGIGMLGALDFAGSTAVGQWGVSGVVGLVVLGIALALLVVMFGELSESEPGPEPWPPRE